jgi:hypothetical protein
MATKSMNLVDSVAEYSSRMARNRSAVLRFGTVATTPAAGRVKITIGTNAITCAYLQGVAMAVGDWVALINDSDKWLVLGPVVPPGATGGGTYLGSSYQALAPPLDSGQWTDYTNAQWPAITFTMPKSGRVTTTISGYVWNTLNATALMYAACRLSGGPISGPTGNPGQTALMSRGTGLRGSKMAAWTGGTPGTTYTCTPMWLITPSDGSAAGTGEGHLLVQALY